MTHCSCCCFVGRTRRCRQHTWADRKWQYSWADREHIHPDLDTHTHTQVRRYSGNTGNRMLEMCDRGGLLGQGDMQAEGETLQSESNQSKRP